MAPEGKIIDLSQKLLDEIFLALGLSRSRKLRWLLEPLFSPATRRFATLASTFDQEVATIGFIEAARHILPWFIRSVRVTGERHIPASGPLLILSNHPGTYDFLVIASMLRHPTLKIVAEGVPFFRSLEATANHLIFSSRYGNDRMLVIRSTIHHLRAGGAVLVFPSGEIDPDPAVMPGALDELEAWSPSLEVILRRVPSARVLITAVSGVLHPGWANSPLTRLRSGRRDQQRVAEFFQVIQQMSFPRSLLVSPVISFSEPLRLPTLDHTPLLPIIISCAKEHLRAHPVEGLKEIPAKP